MDVSQLENAIINLVMNARDAMEGQSGTIKIRTWNQRVTRSDGRRQDMVALEVIDHGSGMSQEIKSRVFEPFFTTKQTGSGSGLGLSMVYGFVRQSGGRVEIESAPGRAPPCGCICRAPPYRRYPRRKQGQPSPCRQATVGAGAG
ncbi:Blue-light-activated protein [Leclercia adecarboxylata]|uniref:histidine kinase n=1 Tax=Leclercia adecarboxylata TaxID=83655 RepID=A0A4U9HFA7_9ENTR|nr:Blue-light-activated protein [Leclercia adecarboxylata]